MDRLFDLGINNELRLWRILMSFQNLEIEIVGL
jgi:hypothetical protein